MAFLINSLIIVYIVSKLVFGLRYISTEGSAYGKGTPEYQGNEVYGVATREYRDAGGSDYDTAERRYGGTSGATFGTAKRRYGARGNLAYDAVERGYGGYSGATTGVAMRGYGGSGDSAYGGVKRYGGYSGDSAYGGVKRYGGYSGATAIRKYGGNGGSAYDAAERGNGGYIGATAGSAMRGYWGNGGSAYDNAERRYGGNRGARFRVATRRYGDYDGESDGGYFEDILMRNGIEGGYGDISVPALTTIILPNDYPYFKNNGEGDVVYSAGNAALMQNTVDNSVTSSIATGGYNGRGEPSEIARREFGRTGVAAITPYSRSRDGLIQNREATGEACVGASGITTGGCGSTSGATTEDNSGLMQKVTDGLSLNGMASGAAPSMTTGGYRSTGDDGEAVSPIILSTVKYDGISSAVGSSIPETKNVRYFGSGGTAVAASAASNDASFQNMAACDTISGTSTGGCASTGGAAAAASSWGNGVLTQNSAAPKIAIGEYGGNAVAMTVAANEGNGRLIQKGSSDIKSSGSAIDGSGGFGISTIATASGDDGGLLQTGGAASGIAVEGYGENGMAITGVSPDSDSGSILNNVECGISSGTSHGGCGSASVVASAMDNDGLMINEVAGIRGGGMSTNGVVTTPMMLYSVKYDGTGGAVSALPSYPPSPEIGYEEYDGTGAAIATSSSGSSDYSIQSKKGCDVSSETSTEGCTNIRGAEASAFSGANVALTQNGATTGIVKEEYDGNAAVVGTENNGGLIQNGGFGITSFESAIERPGVSGASTIATSSGSNGGLLQNTVAGGTASGVVIGGYGVNSGAVTTGSSEIYDGSIQNNVACDISGTGGCLGTGASEAAVDFVGNSRLINGAIDSGGANDVVAIGGSMGIGGGVAAVPLMMYSIKYDGTDGRGGDTTSELATGGYGAGGETSVASSANYGGSSANGAFNGQTSTTRMQYLRDPSTEFTTYSGDSGSSTIKEGNAESGSTSYDSAGRKVAKRYRYLKYYKAMPPSNYSA